MLTESLELSSELSTVKYCEDTRPQHQLDAAMQQHADLCKYISATAATFHPILLGVGGTCYIEHTLNHFKKLGLDHQSAIKLAKTLHAHSIQYAHKLVDTIQNKSTSNSQVLLQTLQIPISYFCFTSCGGGDSHFF
eukprot:1161690-Pelagomonas_calceolata.AAC.9